MPRGHRVSTRKSVLRLAIGRPSADQSLAQDIRRDRWFWASLGAEEQERVERNLVARAPRFLQDAYQDGQEKRGLLFQTVRQALIDKYARGKIGTQH